MIPDFRTILQSRVIMRYNDLKTFLLIEFGLQVPQGRLQSLGSGDGPSKVQFPAEVSVKQDPGNVHCSL